VGAPFFSGLDEYGTPNFVFDRAKSVFINCPFDGEYVPLLDAIIFSVVCCGFLPRSAVESGRVSTPRLDRITGALFSSKYSIHDLSRCRGEGDANIARFNMPLELGMAMTLKLLHAERGVEHDWLLLVPEGHEYVRFISDLAGVDPKRHDDSVETIVPKILSWLHTLPEAERKLKPARVLAALPDFEKEKALLRTEWQQPEIPWTDLVQAAINIALNL
jgi:hypothetical protein